MGWIRSGVLPEEGGFTAMASLSLGGVVMTFLRFLNHYPSHIYLFAAFGRLDVFLLGYVALNALYLAKGWLGLLVRFGRFRAK